ncbi:uncharacterized protein C8Q71DRAFT_60818 [Rhodofomes roseus]|uniref:Uncharacterized protein n=1 Tax=Rhodofomes roseus TaxID=34475 RepID=A0ABQ8KG97_9APHY|nr:uncharacterized protein C8Q71DRAFT_60818 [Rhodofomes roseus]KAH9836803.1 hypothetical protein C8Q71DRAFT_60818 [Rhodofomes roseus]
MSAYRLNLSPQEPIGIQPALYLVACTIRHNAACIWNDVWDRDFDRQVERTKTRPVASGMISVSSALLFLMFLLGYNAMTTALLGFFTLELIYPCMTKTESICTELM